MPVPARASEFAEHSDESLKEESRTHTEGERKISVPEDRDKEIHSSDGNDLDKLDAHKEQPPDDDEQVLEPLPGRDPQIQTPKPRIKQLKQLLRHTNSLNQLPEFGIETEYEPELESLMENIDVWGLNIFDVHKFSSEHSLTCVMFKIFKERNLLEIFDIPSRKLVNYLLTLEAHYLNVPYHNSMHAADVTQAVHVLLLSPALDVSISPEFLNSTSPKRYL